MSVMIIWVHVLDHSLMYVHLAFMLQVVIMLGLDHLMVMLVVDLVR